MRRCKKHIRPILFFLAAVFVLFWLDGFKILKQEIFSSSFGGLANAQREKNPLVHNRAINGKPVMPKK